MIERNNVYRIGRLGKAHGVNGEVTMQCDDDIFHRIDADYLILEVDGLLVPFFIEDYRFRTDTICLMKFCDISSQERARQLTGCDVYFPHSLAHDDNDTLSWAALEGYTICDTTTGSEIGRISNIDDSTQNLLFCMDDGKLIPAALDLINNIDTKRQVVSMNIPAGLLEL